MATAISTATIVLNNIPVDIVPNSFMYVDGSPESSMRATSSGGGSIGYVYSENIEGSLPTFKFSLYPTPESLALIDTLKQNRDQNAASATDRITGFTASFSNAALTSRPERNLSFDGQIDLEFTAGGIA